MPVDAARHSLAPAWFSAYVRELAAERRRSASTKIRPVQRTARQKRLYLTGIAFALLPVISASIAVARSRLDLRYLYAMFASAAAVALVMMLGRSRRRPTPQLLALGALAAGAGLAASTLLVDRLDIPMGAAPILPVLWHLLFALGWASSHVFDAAAWPTSPVTASKPAADA